MLPSLGYFVTEAQTDKDRKSNMGQDGQSIGVSALASFLPKKYQG